MGGGGGGGFNPINAVTQPFREIGGFVGGAVGGEKGRKAGKAVFDPLGIGDQFEEGPKAPDAPGEDPRLVAIREQNQKLADEFRGNQERTKEDIFGNVAGAERRRLSQEQIDTNAGFNRRGLLYSGLRQNENLQNRAASQGRLASARQDINSQVAQRQAELDRNAISGGLNQAQTQAQIQDQVYAGAMANLMGRNQAVQSLFGAGGLAAGAYLGKKD